MKQGCHLQVQQKLRLGFLILDLEKATPVLTPTAIQAKNLGSTNFRIP
jgi:hypothetical protein